MPITFKYDTRFDKTDKYFNKLKNLKYTGKLDNYAQTGIAELKKNTPTNTGLTADSWHYEIKYSKTNLTITWYNDNLTSQGTPIAILLQYGHATRSGTYYKGVDFVNPVMKSVFKQIDDAIWKEINNA